MKLLIDTDWFAAIKDLQKNKQREIMEAILDYPNKDPDTHLWKNVIKPTLERGKIKYFNSLKNLKQNNPQKSAKKISDSESDSDTDSGIDINKYNIISREDRSSIQTTHAHAHTRKTIEEIIKEAAIDLVKRPGAIKITSDFVFPTNQYFNAYRQELPAATKKVETWIRKSQMVGKYITQETLGKLIRKFATK